MAHNTLAFYDNVVPLTQPIDGGTTDFVTPYVQLKGAHRLAFLVQFGVTTQNATTDRINVTVDAATAADGTEAAIVFQYRKSSAVTANTWGAVTTATATGAELTYLEEGMSLWIEVDPDLMGTSDYAFARRRDRPKCLYRLYCVGCRFRGRPLQANHHAVCHVCGFGVVEGSVGGATCNTERIKRRRWRKTPPPRCNCRQSSRGARAGPVG